MKTPVRWAAADSEVEPRLRETIQRAQGYGPTPTQVTALTEAVLSKLPPAQASLASTASAAANSAGALGLVKVAAVALSVGIGFIAWSSSHKATPNVREERAPALPPPAAIVPVVPQPQAAPEPLQTPAPQPRARANKRRTPAQATQAEENLGLLQDARRVRRQHPATALQMLDEHTRLYPNSPFREERDALRIEVLRSIDPRRAAELSRQFKADFPHSVYAQP